MKILPRLVLVCLAAGCATAAAADAASAVGPSTHAQPALYSFSDLYRLTVEGATPDMVGASLIGVEPQPVRVASAPPVAASAEMKFTITPVPGPRPWMLLLAGLAAAAWVAHRRLTRPL